MKYFKKLLGDRIYLSPRNTEDYEIFTEWLNDFEITDYIGKSGNLISLEGEKEFLEKNGYKNTKDFEKHIEKRIVLSNELKDKKEELQAMQDDHAQSQYLVENDTYDLQGGK